MPAGCVSNIIQPDPTPLDGESRACPDWSDYAIVLDRAVTGGRVDYRILLHDPLALRRAVSRLAQCGPKSSPLSFTTDNARLAYWINTYNVLVLRGVVAALRRSGPHAPDAPLPERVSLDVERGVRFIVDGETASAADVRERVLTLAREDWRVRFALCDGKAGGPPLVGAPFLPDLFDYQIDNCVRDALRHPQIVSIDHGAQRLHVWRELSGLRDRLVTDFERRTGAGRATLINVLLEWSEDDQRRALNSAIGYSEHALPFDDHVNHAPQAPATSS